MNKQAYASALQWYIDNGVDEALDDAPVDYYTIADKPIEIPKHQNDHPNQGGGAQSIRSKIESQNAAGANTALGASDAREEAVKLAKQASTLDELRQAIADFDGIGLKKTASNLVFGKGNAQAKIMLIGDAPATDEDREGKPFVGTTGLLLDKILSCIELERSADDPLSSIYISNILNWRPPGNRTPAPGEIEASLPFIERHIQLINPDILIFCGGVTAKALLGSSDSISKLRKKWHAYTPQCEELRGDSKPIKSIVTFHPAQLLTTPAHKKAVWADMLMLQKQRIENGIMPQ